MAKLVNWIYQLGFKRRIVCTAGTARPGTAEGALLEEMLMLQKKIKQVASNEIKQTLCAWRLKSWKLVLVLSASKLRRPSAVPQKRSSKFVDFVVLKRFSFGFVSFLRSLSSVREVAALRQRSELQPLKPTCRTEHPVRRSRLIVSSLAAMICFDHHGSSTFPQVASCLCPWLLRIFGESFQEVT